MPISKIDNDLCTGCGTCVDTCPMDSIRLNTLPGEDGEHPPCRLACPAGVDMRTYIHLLRNGMYERAAESLREQNPFPAITGRVCPHPCETDCARGKVDETVNVHALERFVGDRSLGERRARPPQIYLAGVAVVGSGPAGLSCAWFLARRGYTVTVFEAAPEPGGMLRQAIPEYRLPPAVLDAELGSLRDLGVEIRTGVGVGRDLPFAELTKDYGAVFWAAGNQLAKKLEVPGADLEGVLLGLDFLRKVRAGGLTKLDGSVAVIGGGSVAIDAALTALRLGAFPVELVCLESDEQMPAYPDEVRQAREEGVLFRTCRGPAALAGEGGRVRGVQLVECVSVCDAHGAFGPSYGDTCDEGLEADTVIVAVGQEPDTSVLPEGLELAGGTVRADPVTLATSLPGVFAGGDAVAGPATVASAIGAGRRAAESIDRYLRQEDLTEGRRLSPHRVKRIPCDGMRQMPRQEAARLAVSERVGLSEVQLGLDENAARLESQRCMTCGSLAEIWYPDDCMLCTLCETDCPEKALYVSPEKLVVPLLPWG